VKAGEKQKRADPEADPFHQIMLAAGLGAVTAEHVVGVGVVLLTVLGWRAEWLSDCAFRNAHAQAQCSNRGKDQVFIVVSCCGDPPSRRIGNFVSACGFPASDA